MNVRATAVIDALTGGAVGAGIDMLVCVGIIVATAGVIALKVIALAGDAICNDDWIDSRADVLADM